MQNILIASVSTARLWALWLIGIGVTAAVCFFLFSPSFTIQSISVVRRNTRTDIEEMQQVLRPFFGRHLFFLSPLLVERTIRNTLPEVTEVRITKKYPSEISVSVDLDSIVADVILGAPEDTEAQFMFPEERTEYLYLTQNGVFLEDSYPVTEEDGEERLHIHLVDWAVKPIHRTELLTAEILEAMRTTQNIVEESFSHAVSGITYYVRAREYHIRTEGIVLWFDLSSPSVEQFDRYRQFLRTLSLEEVEEYIDLRLSDRIVYR